MRDKPYSDPSAQDLKWGTLEPQYCDYGNEENCLIQLNGQSVNPFNPGEGFISEIQIEDNLYRQEMFSHDLLCKSEYGQLQFTEPGIEPFGTGECLDEIDCFVGGEYVHYNAYRPTFHSMLAGGANFGPYNEYLIQQKINEISSQ